MPHKIPESVLVVIHTTDLEVLLIERADKPGFWQSVTGSKDTLEESLQTTAIREIAEETGIHIATSDTQNDPHKQPLAHLHDWHLSNIYEIYPMWRHRYPPGVTKNTEHVFGLLVSEPLPVAVEPREHLRFEWLPWREAAETVFSWTNANAIRALAQGTARRNLSQ